jgi:lysophospholipase L1-like esterase
MSSSLLRAQQNVADTAYIKSFIVSLKDYYFLNDSLNYFEYHNTEALSSFFEALKNAHQKKVNVLHIGDSHVQADIGANYIRNYLQSIFGFGGRGAVFPYAAGGTHAGFDYYTSSTGKWTKAKDIDLKPILPLGVSGITIRTIDTSATFSLKFIAERAQIKEDCKRMKLFCALGDSCFSMEYKIDDGPWIRVEAQKDSLNRSFIEIALMKSPVSTINFKFKKENEGQYYAEIYGLSLENTIDKGILYHSVGINGARIEAVSKMDLFEPQIAAYAPDLVVIDLVANDLAFGDFDEKRLRSDLDQAIHRIRNYKPECSILLAGMQDIYVRKRNVENAQIYSRFLRTYSKEKQVAFYDYFRAAGGRYVMKKWKTAKLVTNDMCHLTVDGYQLKGKLFSNALLRAYTHYLRHSADSLLADTCLIAYSLNVNEPKESKEADVKGGKKSPQTQKPSGNKKKKTSGKVHVVKKGESLSVIATKYHTSVAKIKQKNKLKTDKLQIGQKLIIP